MAIQRIWHWRDRQGTNPQQRRYRKAWWGGWPSRIGLVVGITVFLAIPRATSLESTLRVVLPIACFYTLLMLMGWMNNFVELNSTSLVISQMGIVTPGGPTYGGGKIPFSEMVGVAWIGTRKVHIHYNAKDWRRKPTIRTTKLYLENADGFVAELAAVVEATTGLPLSITRRA